jgi:hypothetical protein
MVILIYLIWAATTNIRGLYRLYMMPCKRSCRSCGLSCQSSQVPFYFFHVQTALSAYLIYLFCRVVKTVYCLYGLFCLNIQIIRSIHTYTRCIYVYTAYVYVYICLRLRLRLRIRKHILGIVHGFHNPTLLQPYL